MKQCFAYSCIVLGFGVSSLHVIYSFISDSHSVAVLTIDSFIAIVSSP